MNTNEETTSTSREAWLVLVAGNRQHRRGAVADLVRSLGCDCVTTDSAASSIVELLRRRRQGRPVDIVVADEDLRCVHSLNDVLQRTSTQVVALDDVLPETDVASRTRLTQLRVLVVEDEPVNRLVIASVLRNRSIHVTVVASGEEALEALAAECFDVVLMDIELPGLNGSDTTDLIRSGERTDVFDPAVPIIAITAHTGGMAEAWVKAGMNGYVTKPVEPEDLLATIDDCLGTR